ncbi:MAG: carboxylate-amine ligase [Solirubrobacterales bacterium]
MDAPGAGDIEVGLDLEAVEAAFATSTDFTVGIEEEFALVDPDTLDLVPRFEELREAAADDPALSQAVAGELISSEIEIRSARGEDFAEAADSQADHRRRLFALAAAHGVRLGAMGTHPWASYLDQPIIATPHYRRVEEGLRYVAWRNNTFGLHVHVGVRGADRAIAVCDALRERLPLLLAVSASSPFLDGRDTGLHSVRTQTFTRSFPRCGVPDAFGDFSTYARFVGLLARTDSIREATQLWWSVRPHHRFGTVEVRICDAQPSGEESFALASLIVATVAQIAVDHDDGRLRAPLQDREIEENLWRAIRYGMDGRLIDFAAGAEIEARAALDQLLEWTAPVRSQLGLDVGLPDANPAQRARRALGDGSDIAAVWRQSLDQTAATYGARAGVAAS